MCLQGLWGRFVHQRYPHWDTATSCKLHNGRLFFSRSPYADTDIRLDTVHFFLYSHSELAITIMAANFAALRPLWKRWRGRSTKPSSDKHSEPIPNATPRHRPSSTSPEHELHLFGRDLGKRGRGHHQVNAVGPENTSEEHILQQPTDKIRVDLGISIDHHSTD